MEEVTKRLARIEALLVRIADSLDRQVAAMEAEDEEEEEPESGETEIDIDQPISFVLTAKGRAATEEEE